MHLSTQHGPIELAVIPNTGDGEIFSNIAVNSRRELPAVRDGGMPAVICGGGPSLGDAEILEKIKDLQNAGAVVYALNNSAKFLAERGISVYGQIVLDARESNLEFIKDSPAEVIYLASQCAPLLFDYAERDDRRVVMWHPRIENMGEHMPQTPYHTIGGGTTVGLSGMCLVYTLGHRELHLFGYDSSYRGEDSHAYQQEINKKDDRIRTAVNGRVFYSSVAMAAQAGKFMVWADALAEFGAKVHVHGDGLIPHIVRTAAERAAARPMQAVYDLAVSPPSYDFVTFLSEAEKARIEGGFTCIDITFQPGPIEGFRDDSLPPGPVEREGMLWRICVPMAKCLPSVRNVTVLRERVDMEAQFPAEWSQEVPRNQYGYWAFKDSKPILQAGEASRRIVQRITGGHPYVTITMRQAPYHSWRNSNIATWSAVADHFEERGYRVIIIPDTSGCAITDRQVCWEAAYDIDLRVALYQGAALNTGLCGGPMTMLFLQEAPFLAFVPYRKGDKTGANGQMDVEDREEFYANGKVVFGGDALPRVLSNLEEFMGRFERAPLLETA